MSLITVSRLIAAGIAPTQANTFAQWLGLACDRFAMDTPARQAAFVGQCMVESGLLVHTEEDLFYRDPARIALIFPHAFRTAADAVPYVKNPAKLGARAYAGENGNGDEASGDGYTYRGRGLFQLTGRENYADAANGLAHDYVGSPGLVANPADACMTAAWFWNCNKLNLLADAGDVDAITRAINGAAMEQKALRRQYTQQAMEAFA